MNTVICYLTGLAMHIVALNYSDKTDMAPSIPIDPCEKTATANEKFDPSETTEGLSLSSFENARNTREKLILIKMKNQIIG